LELLAVKAGSVFAAGYGRAGFQLGGFLRQHHGGGLGVGPLGTQGLTTVGSTSRST
jgi:hypothetical protein